MAAPEWQRVADPAPGGVDFPGQVTFPVVDLAVVDGTPYVAWVSPEKRLFVSRPNAAGTGWVNLGGSLNEDTQLPVKEQPRIVSDGSDLWVTWTEEDADGIWQVRVARLVGDHFEQPVAGAWPVNQPGSEDASGPRIAIFDGVPYVAYTDNRPTGSRLDVARLSADGDSFEHVTQGLWTTGQPELAVSKGRLYLGAWPHLARLSTDGTSWKQLADVGDHVYEMADLGGELHLAVDPNVYRYDGTVVRVGEGSDPLQHAAPSTIAAAGGDLYAAGETLLPPDQLGPPEFAIWNGTSWNPLPVPAMPGRGVSHVRLVGAPDGAVWMIWEEGEGAPEWDTQPRTVHVARYGEPVVGPGEPPADAGSQPGGPPEPAAVPPGFTTPDGRPVPAGTDGKGGAPRRRGACARKVRGTRRTDLLVGSRVGESIYGRAGSDYLSGGAGRDCIWGGPGVDYVSGDEGGDWLSGGRGRDRIEPGRGRDQVAAGRGRDVVFAARGGVDLVNCGPGRDTVRLSRNDLIKNCERVIVVR
jgi:hypothetical protein